MYKFANKKCFLSLSGVMASVILSACGSKSEKGLNTPEIQFPSSLYFATADYKTQALIFYRLNTESGQLEIRDTRTESSDPNVFRDPLTGEPYLIERWSVDSPKPSRITKYTETGKVEAGAFPVNTHSIFGLKEKKLLVMGWDKGELALASSDTKDSTQFLTQASAVPIGIDFGAKPENGRFDKALSGNGKTFVLSEGQGSGAIGGVQAKLHLMSTDLTTVATSVDIPGCKAAAGTTQISKSQVALICELYDSSSAPKAMLVDVSSGTPTFKEILSSEISNMNEVFISPLPSLPNHILVSIAPGYMDAPKKIYIVNTVTGDKTPITQYGKHLTYLPKMKSYVAECVIETATKICKEKTFGVIPEAELMAPTSIKEIKVDYTYSALYFETPVFGEN